MQIRSVLKTTLLLSVFSLLACPNGKSADSIQHRVAPGTQEPIVPPTAPDVPTTKPDGTINPGASAGSGSSSNTPPIISSSTKGAAPTMVFSKGAPSPIMQHQCFYTYPATGAQSFTALIDDYVKGSKALKKREPSPNTLLLLERYKHLFEQQYAKNIAGSYIAAYEIAPITDAQILSIQKDEDISDDIKRHVSPKGYRYQNHEAYVDFANRYIGGGVMTQGFVQEEIEIFESSFLPWVADVRLRQLKNADPNTPVALPGCDGPNLLALDKVPVVTYWRMFAHVDTKKAYGTKLHTLSAAEVPDLLQPRPTPVDIFSIAMAAPDFGKSKAPYSREDIENMVLLATRAFYNALLVLDKSGVPLVIHTGNWGAGAFKNSIRTIYAIQSIAIEAAYALFRASKSTPMEYHYDAYDKRSQDSITRYAIPEFRAALGAIGKSDLTIGDYVDVIYRLTTTNKDWQHR